MKKFVLAIGIVTLVASCRNSQEKTLGTQTEVTQPAPALAPVEKKTIVVQQPAPAAETTEPAEEKKKGISKAAKGAIIGGVGGAVVGGVATKSTKGAVIGGVVGAAGGYIIGRNADKKDGSVQ